MEKVPEEIMKAYKEGRVKKLVKDLEQHSRFYFYLALMELDGK